MNKFTQDRPNFVDTDEPLQTFEFNTLAELCEHLQCEPKDLVCDSERRCFCISDYLFGEDEKTYILEISEDEREWWCLGSVKYPVQGIRKWRGAFHEGVDENGLRVEIRTDEIEWYTDGYAKLKDGRSLMLL